MRCNCCTRFKRLERLERSSRRQAQRGITVMLVIAFMGIFLLIMGTITSYAFQQSKYGRALYGREQALAIAEAGLEYYRWFLAHNPGNLTNGTGQPGPYTYTVSDPEGGVLGTASLTVTGNSQCGVLQSIDLTSRGVSNLNPGFPRTIAVRHMQPSVAEYAYITDSTVWFGLTNVGVGPYHANNGMRMDGWTNSKISSGAATVYCDGSPGSLGCNGQGSNPAPGAKTGVFGNSITTALWQYPVSPVDFPGMAVSFPTLQTYTQTSGVMLNPTSVTRAGVQQGSTFSSVGANEQKGFHLVFKADGTVDVYRVTATNSESANPATPVYSYNNIDGEGYTHPVIATESLVANVSMPPGCSIIFSQAKTWIDGVVAGKITLIAADTGAYVPDIILNNNISYATSDGSAGLTAVAEGSIQLGLVIPDTMSVRGIFVAQTGNFGRDYYLASSGFLPASYYQYSVRDTLNMNGTIVSKMRPVLCWNSTDPGNCETGIRYRNNTYERALAFSPPPFTPAVSTDYGFVLWREQ